MPIAFRAPTKHDSSLLGSPRPKDRSRIYKAAASLWAVVLLVISLQPWRFGIRHHSVLHALAHVLAFAILTGLSLAAFGRGRSPIPPLAAAFALGCFIEFAQHLQHKQPPEWQDITSDGMGIAVLTTSFHVLIRTRNAISRSQTTFCSSPRSTDSVLGTSGPSSSSFPECERVARSEIPAAVPQNDRDPKSVACCPRAEIHPSVSGPASSHSGVRLLAT